MIEIDMGTWWFPISFGVFVVSVLILDFAMPSDPFYIWFDNLTLKQRKKWDREHKEAVAKQTPGEIS